MKIALTTAVLALAPVLIAQAADFPHQERSGIPSCVNLSDGGGDNGSASRQSASIGAIPCPEFLSTKTIERKRPPQWT